MVISPGPGRPEKAGRSIEMIAVAEPPASRCSASASATRPSPLAMAASSSARRSRATARARGSPTTASALFDGLSSPFEAGRYHSLVVRERSLPEDLAVTARSEDGLVMALAHRSKPVFGVQFHPESVLTPQGERLLANFLGAAPVTPDVADALKIVVGPPAAAARAGGGGVRRSHGRPGERSAEGRDPARHRDPRRDGRRDRRAPRPRCAAGCAAFRPGARRSWTRAGRAVSGATSSTFRRRRPSSRRERERPSPSTATARSRRGSARRTSWRPAACAWTWIRPGGPDPGRDGPRVPLRAVVPSRDEGARHGPARARHPDDLQRAGSAGESGRRDPPAHRRRRGPT